MSAELYTAAGLGGNNGIAAGTTLEGRKPIHRFINGQPKIIGTAVLVMGASFFISTISIMSASASQHILAPLPPGFMLGSLYITTGILYIVTEHKPTKKTVTMSLAMTIVTILGVCYCILDAVPDLGSYYHYIHHHEENVTDSEWQWSMYSEAMVLSMEGIIVCHSFVGGVIFIVMAALAGSALRSSKSQAIVVMTAAANETPVE